MPYTRVVSYGNQVEVYEYEREADTFGRSRESGKNKKRARVVGEALRLRRIDNLRRVRRDFVRLVGANLVGVEKPVFLTLTMFEVLGIKQSRQAFTRFIDRVRKHLGKKFRFVAVPEFQERGAVHFHVLVWGWPAGIVRYERRYRYLQHSWQRGYLDCVSTDGSTKLAGYLAKYMSKSLQDIRLGGEKAFTASRNIMRPMLYTSSEEFDSIAPAFVEGQVTPLQDKHYETQWLGKGRYRLYKN